MIWQRFSGYATRSTGNESKKRQVGLHQTKMLLHSEGNNQQGIKAICGMGENIYKPSDKG